MPKGIIVLYGNHGIPPLSKRREATDEVALIESEGVEKIIRRKLNG